MPELRILCAICRANSIARPEGATAATTYTCARCCDKIMHARNGATRRARRAAHPWQNYNPPLVAKQILQANGRADSIPTAL